MTLTHYSHFGAYGVALNKDGKILVIKKGPQCPYKATYDLPGGGIEESELLEEALRREVKEETGLSVVSCKHLATVDNRLDKSEDKTCFRHVGVLYTIEVEGQINEKEGLYDSLGALWINLGELNAENSTPFLMRALELANASKGWFRVPVTVMIVIPQDNKILLGKRKNTGFMDGFYALPGGRHDGGESLTHAVIREAREEVGIICQPEDIEFSSFIHFNNTDTDKDILPEILYATFKVNRFSGEVTNTEPHKCEELRFFPIDQLPNNMTDMSRRCIEQAFSNITYAEVDWGK